MSVIVNLAKDSAEALICGTPIHLSVDRQKSLANWIALSCVMAEYTDIKTAAVPASDRAYIMDNKAVPASWVIALGRYRGAGWSPSGYRHWGIKVVAGSKSADPIISTHISTYTIGSLAIHAVGLQAAEDLAVWREKFMPANMRLIYPSDEPFDWPTSETLGDVDLRFISDAFALSYQEEISKAVTRQTSNS